MNNYQILLFSVFALSGCGVEFVLPKGFSDGVEVGKCHTENQNLYCVMKSKFADSGVVLDQNATCYSNNGVKISESLLNNIEIPKGVATDVLVCPSPSGKVAKIVLE